MHTAQLDTRLIVERIWPTTSGSARLRFAMLALLGSLLLTASAKIQVPFWPVKMSMQSFVVLALAAAYGARLGAATVTTYVVLGTVGLPIFQSGGGITYLGGPTTGYLVGFVVAAFVVGRLSEAGLMRRVSSAIAAFVIGNAIIMIAGVAWLTTLIGAEKALYSGLLIFLPAEALKISLATAITRLSLRAV